LGVLGRDDAQISEAQDSLITATSELFDVIARHAWNAVAPDLDAFASVLRKVQREVEKCISYSEFAPFVEWVCVDKTVEWVELPADENQIVVSDSTVEAEKPGDGVVPNGKEPSRSDLRIFREPQREPLTGAESVDKRNAVLARPGQT
jgi:hypothetical protein